MAKIDGAYNYYLTTYGKGTGSRYDSHKKSELRSVYNSIIKTNKDSPLYKITQTGDVTKFAIDIKENARSIQNIVASLSMDEGGIESLFHKKVAVSSNEDAVSVNYVGDDSSSSGESFEMDVKALAAPQINIGNYLSGNGRDFEEGSYSFDLDTPSNSYEFQFNVNDGDRNLDVQNKIIRLINHSDVGLTADLVSNDGNKNAIRITSKQTGLSEGEDYLFHIQSGSSWNELKTLGIDQISEAASNSIFVLNGKEHSSLSNTFTINKSFEITLHDTTESGESAQIGFKANTEAIADTVQEMLSSYNGMVAVGAKYSSGHSNNRLYNEVTTIGKSMASDLAQVGISADEKGQLSLDREALATAITDESAETGFNTLNKFKNALSRQADKAAINPMNYVDKLIVEYKNPGKTFASPYIPSVYSGMLLDHYL